MKISLQDAEHRFRISSSPIYSTPRVKVTPAVDLSTNLYVAWKRYSLPGSNEPKVIRECEVQRSLSHPYITRLVAYYQSEDDCGVITELIDSDLNQEILRRKTDGLPWSEDQIVKLAGMAISAMTYCQIKEVTHRDIKPRNLFLSSDNILKVGDFGESRVIDEEEITIRGTNVYISPELRPWLGDCTPRVFEFYKSDVYSLGISLLQTALLRSFGEMKEFFELEGLGKRIGNAIESIRYSQNLKNLLTEMMKIDENMRPDWIKLAEKYIEMWPSNKGLFNCSKKCSNNRCGNLATKICLCEFSVSIFCEKCIETHMQGYDNSPNHKAIPISYLDEINSATDITSTKAIFTSVETAMDNLKSAGEEIEKTIVSCRNGFKKIRMNLERREQKEIDALVKLQRQIKEIEKMLNNAVSCEKILQKQSFVERLKLVPAPYFQAVLKPTPDISLFRIHEEITSLQHTSNPLAFPIFLNNEMTVYYPETSAISQPIEIGSEVRIDAETVFALIGLTEVAGCGGEAYPTQIFTVGISTGKVSTYESLHRNRNCPGVIYLDKRVYVFGGKNEMSVECLDLIEGKITAKRDLQSAKYKCNPCEYHRKIYIPGKITETYDPDLDEYEVFINISAQFQHISSVVINMELYLFLDHLYYRINIEGPKVVRNSNIAYRFYSNPSPKLVGKFVYFFNSNRKGLKFDTEKRILSNDIMIQEGSS